MDPIEALEGLLKIYSPSYHEGEAISYLEALLRELGMNPKVDSSGNLLAEIGKGEMSILLCGHVDTVPGEIKYRREGDLIYARGSVDAKSSLLALIFAANKLNLDGLKIKIACTVREESEESGISEISEDFLRSDFAVFGEPSNLDGIVIGYRGRIGLNIKSKANRAHASSNSVNVIKETLRILSRISSIEEKYTKDSLFNSLSINPVMIRSGISNNVLPDVCEVFLDIRIPIGVSIEEIKEMIEKEIKKSPIESEILWTSQTNPVLVDTSCELVKAFKKAIVKELKLKPRLVVKAGSSDMNYYASKFNACCISYGPGDPKLEHGNFEFISISDYLKSINVIASAIEILKHILKK